MSGQQDTSSGGTNTSTARHEPVILFTELVLTVLTCLAELVLAALKVLAELVLALLY